MKIMLLNDTATVPHVGRQAVSDAYARMLGSAGHATVERFFLGGLRRVLALQTCSVPVRARIRASLRLRS